MSEFENKETGVEPQQEIELSHTDKLAGLFIEPVKIFEKTSLFPPKTIDWILPVSIVILFAVLSNFILMSNPQIKSQAIDKQLERMEKNFDDMVKKGQLTESQKEEQMERIRESMEGGFGGAKIAIQIVSTIIIVFIMFFVVTFFYHLIAKLILKGEGTYQSGMVANGLTYYIGAIQIIIMTIVSLAMTKYIQGTSISSFLDLEKTEFVGFLLSKVDPLTIWALAVMGVGYAKMYKSNQTAKFIAWAFIAWLTWSFIAYGIAKAVPFLGFILG